MVTTYYRRDHYRTNYNGTRFKVSGHSVNKSFFSVVKKNKKTFINQHYQLHTTICKDCLKDIFYISIQNKKFYFNNDFEPLVKHDCLEKKSQEKYKGEPKRTKKFLSEMEAETLINRGIPKYKKGSSKNKNISNTNFENIKNKNRKKNRHQKILMSMISTSRPTNNTSFSTKNGIIRAKRIKELQLKITNITHEINDLLIQRTVIDKQIHLNRNNNFIINFNQDALLKALNSYPQHISHYFKLEKQIIAKSKIKNNNQKELCIIAKKSETKRKLEKIYNKINNYNKKINTVQQTLKKEISTNYN